MEGPETAQEPQHGLFGRFLRLLSMLGGLVIAALMIYIVIDVVLRYGFNRPLRGSLEITEFAMSMIVFLGIAYCGWLGGHVAVDILERPLDNPRLRLIPVVLTFIAGLLFVAIAWLTVQEALATSTRVSNMMRWPHWPFQFIVAFGSAMYALVLFIQCYRTLRNGGGSAQNVPQ